MGELDHDPVMEKVGRAKNKNAGRIKYCRVYSMQIPVLLSQKLSSENINGQFRVVVSRLAWVAVWSVTSRSPRTRVCYNVGSDGHPCFALSGCPQSWRLPPQTTRSPILSVTHHHSTSSALRIAQPMSCVPEYYCKPINHHTLGSRTIPNTGIKRV